MLPYLFLILLIDAKAAAAGQHPTWHSLSLSRTVASTPFSGQASFFSAYSSPDESREKEVTVRCKLSRSVSNLEPSITIVGVVQQDLVSSDGKIIVPAGSKVIGEGYCDAEQNRMMAKDKWSFYVSDHLIRVAATMQDSLNSEGFKNAEMPDLNEPAVRQAIYRDGVYISVPSGSDFLLRVTGNVSIEELNSAFQDELSNR